MKVALIVSAAVMISTAITAAAFRYDVAATGTAMFGVLDRWTGKIKICVPSGGDELRCFKG